MFKAKKKTLIVLTNQILTSHNYNALCCKIKKKDWKIEYWSILPLLNIRVFEEFYTNSYSVKRYKNFIYIKSLKNLLNKLNKIESNFFYTNDFNQKLIGLVIDKIFKFKGGKRILFNSGDIAPYTKINWYKFISYYFNKNKPKLLISIFNQIFIKPYLFFINIMFSKPKYYFFSNSNSLNDYKNKYGPEKVFAYKHNDIIEFEKTKKQISNKYLVFIDQVRGEEFDNKLNKFFFSTNRHDVKKYWDDLEFFFNHLEKIYPKNKIKIASHHRRFKKNLPNKRKFFFYKTLKLIMQSKLVVSSSSNSLIFALLLGKPILLINHKIFEKYSFASIYALNLLKNHLGVPLVDISNTNEVESLNKKKILQIKKKKYKDYLKNVICINYGKNKKNLIEEITKNLRSKY